MIKDMFDKQVVELKKLWGNKRQLLFQLLNLAMIVFSALMIWKGLMFMTKVRVTHFVVLNVVPNELCVEIVAAFGRLFLIRCVLFVIVLLLLHHSHTHRVNRRSWSFCRDPWNLLFKEVTFYF